MHFTQIEIERELSDAFPQGKRSEVAGNAHIYPSVLLGWFNPDDERKSPHYQVLAVQAELDELYPAIGDNLWNTMCRLRESGKPITLNLPTSELPSLLLTKIRSGAASTEEIAKAIGDGQIDKKEAERLIEVLTDTRERTNDALALLHQRLAEFGNGNLRKVS